jgi:hypothetical protein
MVNDWEIEWNSSMIQHGVDLGTMEFIFAKGGNLSDVNYVMLDQQDNSWEPLIKAVAERDNSHPDIIRKNVPFSTQQMQGQQPQQLFGVDRQQFQPAMPLQAGGVGTAATTPKQARQLLAVNRINQAQGRLEAGGNRGRDMAATGQRMRGLAQGTKNIATEKVGPALGAAAGGAYNIAGKGMSAASRGIKGAGRFLADKFPGAKQRMGNFMQGARDVAQHGYRGLKEYAGQVKQNYGDRQRRNVREGENTKLKDQRDRIARETGGKGFEFDRQNQMLDQTPLAQGQDARDKELRDITGGTNPETGEEVAGRLNENQAGLRDRIRDLGNQRRGTQMTPEQLQEKQKEEAKANEGTIEALNAEVDGASTEAQATANTDVAQTGTPPAPAINPEPVAPEEPEQTFDLTGGKQEPEQTFDLTGGKTSEIDAERMARIQGYLGEGKKPYTQFGGNTSGGRLSQRMYDAKFDPASEEEYAQEMIDAMGIPQSKHGTQLKQRLMNNARFKAAVQQGDEETAQAIVQEEAKVQLPDTAGSGDDPAPIVTFSSDKHAASWDSLMKGMNIR